MEKVKILSSLDEIRTISDPYRMKIIFAFCEDNLPMTVKQIASKLGEGASKVHYHVKELERIGVLEIVETKEKSGIIEKYYLPTAESFKVQKDIGLNDETSEKKKAVNNIFRTMKEDFIKNNSLNPSSETSIIQYGLCDLTREEIEQLEKLLGEFVSDKGNREGTKQYYFGYTLFKKYDGEEKMTDGDKNRD